MLIRNVILSLGIVSLGAGIGLATPKTGPQPNGSIANYRSWTNINDKPIYMKPTIAALCVGPMAWDSSPDNPHVPKYFTVYANNAAKQAMKSTKAAHFPVGSTIVKEKFGSKDFTHPELLTVMVKHSKGYDTRNGDWEYLVFNGDLSKRSSANARTCKSCHADEKEDDFVYRTYVQGYWLNNTKPLQRSGN